MEQKKIIEALRTIQIVCLENETDCKKCPFNIPGVGCVVSNGSFTPGQWVINRPSEWKAFSEDTAI